MALCAGAPPSTTPWHEERLSPADGSRACESVVAGRSVIIVTGFASQFECETLMDSAAAVAWFRRTQLTGEEETLRPGRLRLPVSERLDKASRYVADDLVGRALDLVERELPSVAELLTRGQPSRGPPPLRHMPLVFSPGEPAVNVYTVGGEFSPHEDKQALTLLVPLSSASLYDGGGTAFWSAAMRGESVEPHVRLREGEVAPTLVLRPSPSDAILFAGNVTHAGLPVLCGTRFVFVASFSASQRI